MKRTRTGRLRSTIVALCVLSLSITPAAGIIRFWTGAQDSHWSNPKNWDPEGTPQNGDDLEFGQLDDDHDDMVNDIENLQVSIGIIHEDYSIDGFTPTLSGIGVETGGNFLVKCPTVFTPGSGIVVSYSDLVFTAPMTLTGDLHMEAGKDGEGNGHIQCREILGNGDIHATCLIGGNDHFHDDSWIDFRGTGNTFSGRLFLATRDGTAVYFSSEGTVLTNAIVATKGHQASIILKNANQTGEHLLLHAMEGAHISITGQDMTVGRILLDNVSSDAAPSVIEAVDHLISVNDSVAGHLNNDHVHPTIRGRIQLNNSMVIEASGSPDVSLEIHGNMQGKAFTKTGSGTLLLHGLNSFAGDLIVKEGTLQPFFDGSLSFVGVVGGLHLSGGNLLMESVASSGVPLYVDPESNGNSFLTVFTFCDVGQPSFGSCTWAGPVILNSMLNVVAISPRAGDLALDFSGVISGPGGMSLLPFLGNQTLGPGKVRFSGPQANTFTGPTFVDCGVLELAKSPNVRAVAGPLVVGASDTSDTHEVRWVNRYQAIDNGITLGPTGLLNFNDQAEQLGSITFNGGKVQTGSSDVSVTNVVVNPTNVTAFIEGTLRLPQVPQVVFDVGGGGVDPALTVNAKIFGNADHLIKQGGGTLRFGLANSYFAVTEVREGVLQVDDSASLGATNNGTFVFPNATLRVSSDSFLTLPEFLTLNGGGTQAALDIGSGATATLISPLQISGPTTIYVETDAALGINGSISGAGDLIKGGPGRMVIGGSSPNNYTGDTIVQQGTVALDKANSIAAVPGRLVIGTGSLNSTATVIHFNDVMTRGSVIVDRGSVWDLNGHTQGFPLGGVGGEPLLTLKNGGRVQTGSGQLVMPTTVVDDLVVLPGTVGSSTINGHLVLEHGTHHFVVGSRAFGRSGAECTIDATINEILQRADLVKEGAGRLVLAGANTCTGNTTVSSGTLQIDGSQPQSPISITGGTLQGSGAMGPITMNGPAGILAPHISTGTIVCNTLSAGPGGSGTVQIQLSGVKPGTEYDQLVVHGPCNLNGIRLSAALNFHSAVADKFVIIQADNPIQGTFNGLPEGATLIISGQQFSISYAAAGGTQVVLRHLSEFTGAVSFWVKSQSGDWNDPANWDTQTVPNASNAGVTNNDATAFSISNSANVAISGFLFASPSATIAGSGDFDMSGLFSWVAGSFTNVSTLRPNGGLSISGAATKTLSSKTIVNSAVANWSDNGAILFTDGAVLQNAASGTFECAGDGSIQNGPGSNLVINAGVFRKTGGTGTTEIDVPFNNTGTVEVLSGTLLVNNGGTNMGSYVVASGQGLLFGKGIHTFTASSAITGSGNLSFSSLATVNLDGLVNIAGTHSFNGGTVNLNGSYNFDDNDLAVTDGALNLNGSKGISPATLTVSSFGKLGGSDPISVTGLMLWDGSSTISGGNIITANGGLMISGNVALEGRTLINTGSGTWSNNPVGSISLIGGAVLSNAPSATFETIGDGVMNGSGDSNVFWNAGVFSTTGPTNQTTIFSAFNNSGTVNVGSATLNLYGGGSQTGDINVAPGSVLGLMGGTKNFDVSSVISGDGNLQVGGGVANLAGTVALRGTHTFTFGTANIAGNYQCVGNTVIIRGGTANFDSSGTIAPNELEIGSFGILGGANMVSVTGPLTLGNTATIRGRNAVIVNGGLNASGNIFLGGRTLINNSSAIWTNSGPAAFNITDNATVTNAGPAVFNLAFDGIFSGGPGTNAFVNAGLFRKSAGTGSAVVQVPFFNTGTVEIDSGTLEFSSIGPFVQNDGVTRLNGGNIATALPLQINGGRLEGSGTISGSVINGGLVRPGKGALAGALHAFSASPSGQIVITGDYIQTSDGVLELEISPNGSPQLVVSNSITLAGTLNLKLADGAALPSNGILAILSSSNVNGSFAQINTSVTNAAVQLTLQGTNLVLQVANVRPALAPIPDQTILSSATLRLVTHASDPDLPAQTLTYRLINSPTDAVIDTNGVITWIPSTNSPKTNSFSVVVNDSGTPRLSAVQSFNVILSDRAAAPTLSLTAVGTNADSYTLSFIGTPGLSYVAQYATNAPGPWLDFATNNTSSDGLWSVLDVSATNRARFYRTRSQP